MSPPTSPISSSSSPPSSFSSDSSSALKKRRRSSSSSSVDNDDRPSHRLHHQFSPLVALPPPMVSYSDSHPPPPPGMAYYPVYTSHNGQFYIASPPLDPTASYPSKILPKLPHQQHPQAPLTPNTLPSSPVSTPYTFYHPYQLSPPIQPTNQTMLHHTDAQTQSSSSTGLTTAHQREQARKISHSAIERRRRERINDKIMQLKELIPTCKNQENLHKMSILQSSIDYITYLKDILQQVDQQGNQPIKSTLDLIDGKMKIKTTKSMLPKEVEPYTSQFNAHQPSTQRPVSPPLSNDDDLLQKQQCLKPMDIILTGTRKQPSSDLPTPALTPTIAPSPTKTMSVKDLLC